MRTREALALAGILGLAATVRLYRLDLTWYFLDQVRDVTAAASIAQGVSWPLLGPRIGWTDAYPGPLFFYLLAIPFGITRDPMVAPAFVALGQLVAVAALYRFAAEFFDRRVALWSAALFAVFPLTVFTARLSWQPGLLPPFVVFFMHALYRVIIKQESRSVAVLCALLAVLTQLHLTAVALAGVALLALLLFRPRVRPVHALLGIGLFVALYLPYLAYEVAARFENTRAVFRGASEQGGVSLDGLSRVLGNALILFAPALDGFSASAEWPPALLGALHVLHRAEALLFCAGIAIAVGALVALRGRTGLDAAAQRRRLGLLLLWVGVPIAILGTKKTAVWYYYLDVVYPGPFILAALALTTLPGLLARVAPGRRQLAWGLSGAVLAIIAVQVWFQFGVQRRVARDGELVVHVPAMAANATTSPFERLINLPLGYRRDVLRALVGEFGVGEAAFRDRVHGAVLGFAEDNRYIVAYWAARRRADPPTSRDRSLTILPTADPGLAPPRATGEPGLAPPGATGDTHYLVARAEAATFGDRAVRSVRVGPYAVVEFHPRLDYQTWRCGVALGGRLDSAVWRTLSGTAAAAAPLVAGADDTAVCRGRVHVPADASGLRISLSQVGLEPFDAEALTLDGRPVARVGRQMRAIPWMLKNAAGWRAGLGWATESVFDLGAAGGGEHLLELTLGGPGAIVALDVYEGRSW